MSEVKPFHQIIDDAKKDYQKQKEYESAENPLSEICREFGIDYIGD